jgi:nitroreductase
VHDYQPISERAMRAVDEVIRQRRSVRGFLPKEVPDAVLREVFELAQQAPSNCNVQPWMIHVVSSEAGRQLRDKLLAAGRRRDPLRPDWPADGKYDGVYRDRQYDAAARLYGAMGVERKDMEGRFAAYLRNQAFFDAPHVAFIFLPMPFDVREATDCGIYAQTLLLALTARGIGSCAQGALGLYPDLVREHLGVPCEHRLLLGISFGYEDTSIKANAARVGRAELVHAVQFHR